MRTRKLFASYCRIDGDFVSRICDLLRLGGTHVFRDEDSIQPGKQWKAILTENLQQSECVLVFWTANSASSKEVQEEYTTAIQLEKDVAPVPMDDTTLVDALRDYQWIDFRSLLVVRPVDLDKPAKRAVEGSAVGRVIRRVMYPVGGLIGAAIGAIMGAATVTGVHYVFRALSDESQEQLVELFAQRIFDKVGGTFHDGPTTSPAMEIDAPWK